MTKGKLFRELEPFVDEIELKVQSQETGELFRIVGIAYYIQGDGEGKANLLIEKKEEDNA